jgi:hypothetical protein
MTHFAHRAAKATKISRYFSTAREMVGLPGEPGRLLQHGQTSKLVTVPGNFSTKGDLCRRRRDAKPRQDVTASSDEGAELDAVSV